MKKQIFLIFLMSLLAITVLYANKDVEQVSVTAEASLEFDSEKSRVDLAVVSDDILDKMTKDITYIYDFSIPNLIDVLPAIPNVLYSNNPIKPQFFYILENPILKFRTKMLEKIKKWEFLIMDSRGEMFYKIKGKFTIPEIIDWDGRGSKGDMIVPGQWYSYVFKIEDNFGYEAFVKGETFKVKGVIYSDKKKNQIISLSLVDMFNVDSFDKKLLPEGEKLLEEAVNYIKFYYKNPILIIIYDVDEKSGQEKGEMILNYLRKSASLADISYQVKVVASYISEYRVEIVVLNK